MEALVEAFGEIIWRAGEDQKAVVCFPETKHNPSSFAQEFQVKAVPEALKFYEFTDFPTLLDFLRLHIHMFTNPEINGCLFFLYSLMLSRGFHRLTADLETAQLLSRSGTATIPLLNLLLTGRATPYLHNGVMYMGSEDSGSRKALNGISARSETGLLILNSNNDLLEKQIGSRLKTPFLPIWVTCSDDQYGILFSSSKELIRNYRAERRFDLHYYSNMSSQMPPTVLSIDTRQANVTDTRSVTPILEKIILTKWHGAEICWNGSSPYI